MGMCCSDDQKKKQKGHKGTSNPFRKPGGHETNKMVHDAVDQVNHDGKKTGHEQVTDVEEEHHEENVQGGHMEETTIVEDRRNHEGQEMQSGLRDGRDGHHEDCRVMSEHGWLGLVNEKIFGKDHHYYHQDVEVMACMDLAHLEDPGMAHKYLNMHSRNKKQGIYFDMEKNCDGDRLDAFAKVIAEQDHLEDIHLVFYENQHLSRKHFERFVEALSKQRHLRRLCVNLRWCKEVTDEWLECLGEALPEHLEYLELWVYNCHQVTDVGLGHMMKHMDRCEGLADVKIYAENTGMTKHHQENFKNFMSKRKFKTMRMVGMDMEVNEC